MATRSRSSTPCSLGGVVERVDLVVEHAAWPGRGGPPAPTSLPRPGVPRPSATTTAKPWSANHCDVRWALWARTTRARVRARRTGRAARAAASRRGRVAAARPWRSADRRRTTRCTSARTLGVAANVASSTPSSVAHCAPGSSSVAVRMTIVPPPAATACTPGSSVSASSSSAVPMAPDVDRRGVVERVGGERRSRVRRRWPRRAPAGRAASPARRRRAAGGCRRGRHT